VPWQAQQNRRSSEGAVRLLADSGIRQFLDIGSGLPTRSNVHEIAQRAVPKSRVVYVDYDSVVVGHARALLEKGSPGVSVVVGRPPRPRQGHPRHRGAPRLQGARRRPALFAILHFLRDDDKPHEVVRTLTNALAAGGALAVSHITRRGNRPGEEPGRAAGLPGRVSPGRAPLT